MRFFENDVALLTAPLGHMKRIGELYTILIDSRDFSLNDLIELDIKMN